MSRLPFYVRALSLWVFAIIFIALLIQSFLFPHRPTAFPFLWIGRSEGDQAVQSLDVSPNRDVSIQIFGKGIQSMARNDSIRSASSISTRLEYDDSQVVYAGFDAGGMLPNPDVRVEKTRIQPRCKSTLASLDGSATVNSVFRHNSVFAQQMGFPRQRFGWCVRNLSGMGHPRL